MLRELARGDEILKMLQPRAPPGTSDSAPYRKRACPAIIHDPLTPSSTRTASATSTTVRNLNRAQTALWIRFSSTATANLFAGKSYRISAPAARSKRAIGG